MNKVILIGRLVKDPDIRMGTNNTTIARYTLAVERQYRKNNERTSDFINCVALGKNGEFAEKYLHKGMKIAIVGSWQTGNYTDKDGKKVYTNDCLVASQGFAESKKNQPEEQSQPPVPSPEQDTSGFMDMPSIMDDELPFN
jgi:single-strand DNA-binding protein